MREPEGKQAQEYWRYLVAEQHASTDNEVKRYAAEGKRYLMRHYGSNGHAVKYLGWTISHKPDGICLQVLCDVDGVIQAHNTLM